MYEFLEREGEVSNPTRPRVFVVHGHDEAAKLAVVNFLEELDLEPFVLEDEPNFGHTALELIEEAKAEYAIVVLTPDDSWGERRRVRQNVILELGFFIGRLGRNKVCSLYRPSIELPSDFHGALYIEMDTEGYWRRALARELIYAGIGSANHERPAQSLKRTPDGAS
ncbi:MAG: nucleotide-binding protein [Thermoanaerobaculia bacterium]